MLSKEEIVKIREQLQKHFPKAFQDDGVVILKKGINKNIYESGVLNEVSQTKINRFLAIYTKRFKYLKAHKAGANRYDLEGNISGEVTAKEEEYAKAITSHKNLSKETPSNKGKSLQEQVKQEKSDKDNSDDLKNAESKSKFTGTLKLNFSTKLSLKNKAQD